MLQKTVTQQNAMIFDGFFSRGKARIIYKADNETRLLATCINIRRGHDGDAKTIFVAICAAISFGASNAASHKDADGKCGGVFYDHAACLSHHALHSESAASASISSIGNSGLLFIWRRNSSILM